MTRRAPEGRSGSQAGRGGVFVAALATGALALILRLFYLLEASDNPLWRELGLDMQRYDAWARSVLAGSGLGPAPFTQAPLFPLLLSAAYAILGANPVAALWIHLIPGVAAVVLVAWVAGSWRGPSAAWAAGALLALYKPAIFYTGVLLPPAWLTGISAVAVFLGWRASGPDAGPMRAVAAGAAVGVLSLGQPVSLALFPAMAAYLALGHPAPALGRGTRDGWEGDAAGEPPRRSPRWGRQAMGVRSLWLTLGVAFPLALSFLYNGLAGKTWALISVNGGVNLYIGNGPGANGAYVRPPGLREDRDLLGVEAARQAVETSRASPEVSGEPAAVSGEPAGPGSSESSKGGFTVADANRYWTRRALREMARNPLRTLRLYGRKLLYFFGQYEIPQIESLPFERRYSALLRAPLPGMAVLAALGLFGALLLFREDRTARWLSLSVLLFALGVSVFFVTARFRLPVVPWLAVLAGGGLSVPVDRYLRRGAPAAGRSADVPPVSRNAAGVSRRAIGIRAGVAVLFGALLSANLAGIDREAEQGQYVFRLGVIAEKAGRMEEAVEHYRAALAADPDQAKARINLGTLLARSGNLSEARPLLERGVELDPLSGIGHQNLGQLDLVEGRPADALREFLRALEIEPTLLSARESAAYLLYVDGRVPEARRQLETVAGQAPEGSPPRIRASRMLSILDTRDEIARARGSLTTGSRPAWWGARALLEADVNLVQGRRPEAVQGYENASADPAAAVYARDALRRLGVVSPPSTPAPSPPPDPSGGP